MQIEPRDPNGLAVSGLPDGSKVIVDSKNERVYALNATAGAAWDACHRQATLSGVADDMRRAVGPELTDEVAEQAVAQLSDKNLIKTTGLFKNASRRQVLAGLTAAALPLVVSMTMTEQKAFAQMANSSQSPNDPGNNGNDWNNRHPDAHVSHKSDDRI